MFAICYKNLSNDLCFNNFINGKKVRQCDPWNFKVQLLVSVFIIIIFFGKTANLVSEFDWSKYINN